MAFGGLKGVLQIGAKSITNPFSAVGSVSVSIGDLIVCTLSEQTGTSPIDPTSVTDNLHTPTTYTAQNAGTDAGTIAGRTYFIVATVAGTLTSVNATCTASTNNATFGAFVIEGPFAVTASVVDTNVANTSGTTITSTFSYPATGTLAQASEFVYSWISTTPQNSAIPVTVSPAILIGDILEPSSSVTAIEVCGTTTSGTGSVTQQFTTTSQSVTAWAAGTISFKAVASDTLMGMICM